MGTFFKASLALLSLLSFQLMGCSPQVTVGQDQSSQVSESKSPPTSTPNPTPTPTSTPSPTPGTTPSPTPSATPAPTPSPTPAPTGKTYEVGAGKTYSTLAQIANLVAPGDLVLVYGGATYAGQRFTRAGTAQNKIFIRGVRDGAGNRPIISGGVNTIEAAADHYVFESLQITGGSSRCFFHHADDITIRDTKVFNCSMHGILGADDNSGSINLEYVEVTGCGSGTQYHPIYIATDQKAFPGSVFRMKHSYIHANNGGNAIKSRAERNEIYYNWIEASLYRALELIGPDFDSGNVTPNLKREDSDVVGNLIYQPQSFYAIRMGGDKANSDTNGRYRFMNNTFVVNGGTAVFQAYLGVQTVEIHNNAFVKTGASLKIFDDSGATYANGRRVAGVNNWMSTGATMVPTEWTGSISGADPGFVNLGQLNVKLSATSPLLNKALLNPASIAGYEFPNPLVTPAFLAPLQNIESNGQAQLRVSSPGMMSIGAFER